MPEHWIGIIILGLLIGFLSGLLGTGGGFLLVPFLRAIFGIPYNIAIGSSLFQMVFASTSGTIKHFKANHVNIRLGLLLFCGSVPGAEFGARLLQLFKRSGTITVYGYTVSAMDFSINIMYLMLLSAVSIIMFREAKQWQSETGGQPKDLNKYKIKFFLKPACKIESHQQESLATTSPATSTVVRHEGQRWIKYENSFSGHSELSVNMILIALTGFVVGLLSGLLGVGGGFILIPILICTFKIPAVIAVGTSLFQIIFTSLYGAVTHSLKGNVSFILVGLLVCGAIPGSLIGSTLTEKIRGRKIRLCFAIIILIAAVVIAAQLLMTIAGK